MREQWGTRGVWAKRTAVSFELVSLELWDGRGGRLVLPHPSLRDEWGTRRTAVSFQLCGAGPGVAVLAGRRLWQGNTEILERSSRMTAGEGEGVGARSEEKRWESGRGHDRGDGVSYGRNEWEFQKVTWQVTTK